MKNYTTKPVKSRKRSSTNPKQLVRGIMMIKHMDLDVLAELLGTTRKTITNWTKEDLHE